MAKSNTETNTENSTENSAKKPQGRPSSFTQEQADEICDRIMLGEPVRQIALLEHMPEERTIYRWLASNESFRQQYTRAKEEQAERFAEELLEIVDDGTNDWIERENERTGQKYMVQNTEAVGRSKLRYEARRWLMGKMKPKKYGDNIDVTSKGERIVEFTLSMGHKLAGSGDREDS